MYRLALISLVCVGLAQAEVTLSTNGYVTGLGNIILDSQESADGLSTKLEYELYFNSNSCGSLSKFGEAEACTELPVFVGKVTLVEVARRGASSSHGPAVVYGIKTERNILDLQIVESGSKGEYTYKAIKLEDKKPVKVFPLNRAQ